MLMLQSNFSVGAMVLVGRNIHNDVMISEASTSGLRWDRPVVGCAISGISILRISVTGILYANGDVTKDASADNVVLQFFDASSKSRQNSIWATNTDAEGVVRESFLFLEDGVGAFFGVNGVVDKVEEHTVQTTTVQDDEKREKENNEETMSDIASATDTGRSMITSGSER